MVPPNNWKSTPKTMTPKLAKISPPNKWKWTPKFVPPNRYPQKKGILPLNKSKIF